MKNKLWERLKAEYRIFVERYSKKARIVGIATSIFVAMVWVFFSPWIGGMDLIRRSITASEGQDTVIFTVPTPVAKVAAIRVSGEVSMSWADTLEHAMQSDDYSLIIVIINSGGGGIAESMATKHRFDILQKLYDTPIAVYSESGMFSGAYMVAMSSKFVGVSPGASTGSIGVLAIHEDDSELFRQAGVKFTVIKSGKNKAIFLPMNTLTQQQLVLLQNDIMYMYHQFVNLIIDARGNKIQTHLHLGNKAYIDSLYILADGRTYPSQPAAEYGLIDTSCYFDEFTQAVYNFYGIDTTVYIEMGKKELDVFGRTVDD